MERGTYGKLFLKGDNEVPGNYRGITLLNVVGKVFCKIHNRRLHKGRLLHEGQAGFRFKRSCIDNVHEGQAGFRLKRSCIDNVYTLNELVQGRLREGKTMYADVQKAYDMVWHDGLWLKLRNMGVKGRI